MNLIKVTVKNSRNNAMEDMYISPDGNLHGYIKGKDGKFTHINFEDSRKVIALCRDGLCEMYYNPESRIGNFHLPIHLIYREGADIGTSFVNFVFDQSKVLNVRLEVNNLHCIYNFLLPYTSLPNGNVCEKRLKKDLAYQQAVAAYQSFLG
jgi:hypothetical protein